MQPSSPDPAERTRKNLSAILRALASAGQVAVARDLHTSEATVSRWKAEHAQFVAGLLASLQLKVVPIDMRCFDPRQIGAVLELARRHLNQIDKPEELAWEDEPE